MSALVPHLRPRLSTGVIKSGLPVSGQDWSTLAGLANWCNGHGAMLIPWCAIGRVVPDGNTEEFHFYVAPKLRAVERVWVLNLRASAATGVSVIITVGGASGVTVYPTNVRSGRRNAFVFRESLSAKTETPGDVVVGVKPNGGTVRVESLCMYEQTRAMLDLDTTDYGVDLTSTRPRQPIADFANRSAAGVIDAMDNLDARRAGIFHWSTPEGSAIQIASVSLTDLFTLTQPALGAVRGTGTVSTDVLCAVYAKITPADKSATVQFDSDQFGGTATVTVSSTSFAWVENDLDIDAEDLTIADGRRDNVWEAIRVRAQKGTADRVDIAGVAVVRGTKPI